MLLGLRSIEWFKIVLISLFFEPLRLKVSIILG